MPVIDTSIPFIERKLSYIKHQMEEEDARSVHVHDIRGHEGDFSLDKQGFQLCKRQIKADDFTNDEKIEKLYYPDIEALLKEV